MKEGSIIDVSYKISSPFWFNFHNWEFQSKIPTRISEYRAKIPEYFNYQKFMQGYVSLDVIESASTTKTITLTSIDRADRPGAKTLITSDRINYREDSFRWAVNNVPAFKEEPDMNSLKDYISKINFELAQVDLPNQRTKRIMGTWEDINNNFLKDENFGSAINGSPFLKNKVEEVTTGIEGENQKIASIYNYVKENVQWDETYRKYTDESFKKVIEQKKGSSAEINLLLTCMLKKAGFSADPVLISTRSHGMVRENFPLSSQFNYVICLVKTAEKTILLDATDRSLPINILPERCLNGKGLLISKDKSTWINLASNFKSKSSVSLELALSEDGVMKGKISLVNTGYNAQRVRTEYSSKGEAEYLKHVSETNHWSIEKSEFENVNKLAEPIKETYEVVIDDHVQNANGVIYLNPIIKDRLESNPYKSEKREYPGKSLLTDRG